MTMENDSEGFGETVQEIQRGSGDGWMTLSEALVPLAELKERLEAQQGGEE